MYAKRFVNACVPRLKKDLQAKTIESQSNFIRYQADM